MEEKTVKQDGQFEKYPYSFELRINDNIVCQRYFKINGFKETSLVSEELTETLKYCAKLIKEDLRSKSNLYYEYTAPQIFKDEAQMREWEWWNKRRNVSLSDIAEELANAGDDTLKQSLIRLIENGNAHEADKTLRKYTFTIEPCSYVILENEEKTFFWNGNEMEVYNKYFDRNEYLPSTLQTNQETPCVLKLAFLVNDNEICSTVWDGNIYPRFIRTNIDLSNSKNKYKTGDKFSPFEAAMVDIMNEQHSDLIPVIVKEFCLTCSDDDGFTTILTYGSDKPEEYETNGKMRKYKNTPSHKIFNLNLPRNNRGKQE